MKKLKDQVTLRGRQESTEMKAVTPRQAAFKCFAGLAVKNGTSPLRMKMLCEDQNTWKAVAQAAIQADPVRAKLVEAINRISILSSPGSSIHAVCFKSLQLTKEAGAAQQAPMIESPENTKKALEAYKSLVDQSCAIMVRYLVPNGISEKECIEELFGVLDGPQYRLANKLSPIESVPKHPLTHGGEK